MGWGDIDRLRRFSSVVLILYNNHAKSELTEQLIRIRKLVLGSRYTVPGITGIPGISDSWKMAVGAQVFTNIDDEDLLFSFRDDHYLLLELARFF